MCWQFQTFRSLYSHECSIESRNEPKSEVVHKTKFSLKISCSTHVCLAQLDWHQTCKPVMFSCEFNSHSMLILYKNVRNVRFVLFTTCVWNLKIIVNHLVHINVNNKEYLNCCPLPMIVIVFRIDTLISYLNRCLLLKKGECSLWFKAIVQNHKDSIQHWSGLSTVRNIFSHIMLPEPIGANFDCELSWLSCQMKVVPHGCNTFRN